MTLDRNVRFNVAIHVLVLLAVTDEPRSSDEMAAKVQVHPVFLRRVLGMLHRAGIVQGRAGHHGGFRLMRTAEQIGLDEIYRAVEAARTMRPPRLPGEACAVGRRVAPWLASVRGSAEDAFLEALAGRNLAEAVRRVGEPLGSAA